MVEKIESYTQKNGNEVLKVHIKVSADTPEELKYFYTDASNLDLVEKYSWRVNKGIQTNPVVTMIYKHLPNAKGLLFHREYAYKVLGYYPDYIDHINGLEIDNIDENLNVVTNQQNAFNRPTKGYGYNKRRPNGFTIRLSNNGKEKSGGAYPNEFECIKDITKKRADFGITYDYNFLKDRRGELDLLDLERTGVVSEEEATYRHVRRFIDTNPWYVYRYNLQEYCKDNNIVIPDFRLDEQGFMIHPVTGKRFSPYEKEVLL